MILMKKSPSASKAQRRARTRSLIQLGGLVEKAGLLNDFGIELGLDLQKDEEMKKPAAILLGGLLEIKVIAKQEPAFIDLWAVKGSRALGN
jgi:hypothetical protein